MNAPLKGKVKADDSAQQGQSLYASAEKIYPRAVSGMYANLRVLGVLTLLGIYYGTPWLQWGGRQAILFDLPARKFHIFGLTLWPQDFIYLAVLLIIAGLSLFFVTALAGRVWCGYACPQTVWTEAFLWIERKVEGTRIQQQKLDKAPLSLRKLRIKGTKHTLWILFAAWTGFTFVGYFTPITELGARVFSFQLGPWETFWIIFYSFATWGNAGWMREQVCKYMCPYARFQSAMFDRDTLIIAYDEERGDPRGSRKRSADPQKLGLGDCVDCTLCVQVCPTGIDIRDGLQIDCIACSACVDACDGVMDKMGYAKGLIRYTTENSLLGKKTSILRPRIIIYFLILATIVTGFGYSISQRGLLDMDVIRDRNSLYRENSFGEIENVYTVRIVNKHEQAHEFVLGAAGIGGLQVHQDQLEILVDGGSVRDVPIRLRVSEDELESRSTPVTFTLQSINNPELSTTEPAVFLGPNP